MPPDARRRQPRIRGRGLPRAADAEQVEPPPPYEPPPSPLAPEQVLERRREGYAWAYGLAAILGLWLLFSPVTLGH
jgi:hypothetical protein